MFRQLWLMLQIIESKQNIFSQGVFFFGPGMQSKICWQATCCLVIVMAQAGEAEITFSFVGVFASCYFNCFFYLLSISPALSANSQNEQSSD